MTEITLRAYIREIDNLIEQEKLDEAIAHCRHLLQRHPKYIECYRLLGKAYLEAKRFGDAADIFQRVLSTVPDDFVSHIGMSIVREDEGNLDSAIWHMERAFETNPANPAIQQELKRLIGRRDGFEPHKVRLTRGALARMYAHGELYPQAIAELQSALDEHSDRPDLQVLLAKLLWQTEHRTEAAEVSGELLEKLPYCMQATRIMAAVLQHRGNANEATGYHRRLAQLDPYMAYTEAPMADPARVDADTIMVQKLDWKPGQPLPSTEAAPADWAASLGLDQDEGAGPGTGPLPSWLSDVESTGEQADEDSVRAQPFEGAPEPESMAEPDELEDLPEPIEQEDAEPEAAAEDGPIPDWMEDAGWQESSGEVEEKPVSFSAEELDQLERGEMPAEEAAADLEQSGDLEPADIPSWLRGMAPGDEEEEGEGDDELEAILRAEAEPTSEAPTAEESEAPASAEIEEEAPGQEVPAWLDEGEPGATSTIMTWLGDREEEEPEEPTTQAESGLPEPEEELPTPESPEEEDVPSWLSGVAQAAADSEAAEEQELAELRQQASQAQEDAEEAAAESSESGEVPDWLQSIAGGGDKPDEVTDEELETLAEEAELPWEAEVEAAEQETIPREEEQPTEADAEEAPGWLGDFDETEQPAAAEPASEEEEDWLAGLGETLPEEEEELAEEASWLEELGSEPEADFESETEAAVPGWMDGLAEEPVEDEVEARASTWLDDLSDTLAETPAEPEAGEEVGAPDLLEQMEQQEAARPDSPDDELREELAEEEDLGWLQEMDSAETGDEPASEPMPSAAELDDIDEDGVFDWLDQMAAQQDQAATPQEPKADQEEIEAEPEVSGEAPPETIDEGLDWLDRLSETRGIDADLDREPAAGTISGRIGREPAEEPQESDEPDQGQWEPEASEEETLEAPEPTAEPGKQEPEEEIPSWLLEQGEEEVEAAEEPAVSASEEEAPSWLQEHAEPSQPPAPTPEAVEDSEPEAPDWLMAAADEEGSAGEPAQADPAEEAPDWLQEHAEPTAAAEEPSAEPAPEAPEWLQQEAEPIEPEPAEEAPDWLREHSEPDMEQEQAVSQEPTPATEPTEAPAEEIPPAQAEAPTASEQEEVPDWLKSQVGEETAPTPEPEPTVEEQPPEPEASQPAQEPAAAETETPAVAKAEEPELAVEPATPTPEPVEAQVEPAAEPAPPTAEPEVEEPAATHEQETEPTSDELATANRHLESDEEQQAAEVLQALIKDRRQLEAIVELLEEYLAGEPDAPLLWQVLGDAYMRLNRTDKAVRAYDRGMEESEVFDSARQALAGADYERAAAQYGMLIKNKKRLDVVIEDLEKAVEGDKGDPRIWQILGDAYMKADRIDDSIEAYRKGMDSV